MSQTTTALSLISMASMKIKILPGSQDRKHFACKTAKKEKVMKMTRKWNFEIT